MKCKSLLFLSTLSLFVTTQTSAQYARSRNMSRWATDMQENQKKWVLSATLGTTGFGLEAKTPLSRDFNLRFGTSLFRYKYSSTFKVDAGRSTAEGTANVNFNKFHVLVEGKVLPWFRVVGGLGFYYQSSVYVYGKMLDGIYSNGKYLTAEEAGGGNVGIEWNQHVAPYFGIGLLRDVPMGKFNINADLGSYYLGKPTSIWIATTPDAQEKTAEFKKTLDDVIDGVRFWPVLQINLNYAIQ